MRKRSSKGFTLIEMLIVIAIIAVLVAMVVPTVLHSTEKAKAATDAANLRSALGQANVILADSNMEEGIEVAAGLEIGECKSFPNAHMELVFVNPGFIDVYYIDGSNYYGIDYFSNICEDGSEDISISNPYPDKSWYPLQSSGEG